MFTRIEDCYYLQCVSVSRGDFKITHRPVLIRYVSSIELILSSFLAFVHGAIVTLKQPAVKRIDRKFLSLTWLLPFCASAPLPFS